MMNTYACMLAGQLVVINSGTETVPGSAVGDGPATLDLRDSMLFFAGVPKNVYTSRSIIFCFYTINDDCLITTVQFAVDIALFCSGRELFVIKLLSFTVELVFSYCLL